MEAFAVAANIISVIHVTTEVIRRLNDFKTTVNGIPRALQGLSNELPTLKHALDKIHQAIEDGAVAEDSIKALHPLITDFGEQIRAISDIIDKMQPKNLSRMARNLKAVMSFRYDEDIKYRESVIRGYVSTLSLERVVSGPSKNLAGLRPPPVPKFVCPFGQDPDFVERTLVTDLMAKRRPGSRLALIGEGGIGKSQIAIEYGYRVHEANPDTWVFWVDAENTTKFEASYREIAEAVPISGLHKEADVCSLVFDWLRHTANGNWVMIIDNADDKDIFTSRLANHSQSEMGKQIREVLPQSSNGSILVTSRSRDAAFQVTCNYKHILAVEPMSESEAMSLLRSQLEEAQNDDDMKLLIRTLDYVPLAISQAAAYISRRSLSISDYLEALRKGNETSRSLLDESLPQLRRDSGRSNSIVDTWKITFETFRKRFSKGNTGRK